jgi:4-aminobutyrate aminotransferase-like enzyme/Ser/Thr protein kinase RdoA (MazF antagonist)
MSDAALFDRTQLPRPNVSIEDAENILRDDYGLSGTISELGSQQDRNFRVDTDSGRYVLKICRVEYAAVELQAQNSAMTLLAGNVGGPRVPMPVPALDGEEILSSTLTDGVYQIRLLTFLDGEPLTRKKHLAEPVVTALGTLCATLARDLRDFDHAGLERDLQWDLRRAGPVALHLLTAVTDQDLKDRVAKTMVGAIRRIRPLADELRVQAIHQDVTDDNVVGRPDIHGRWIPDGVIDFGDLIKGWLVADLAVTCASLLHHGDGDPLVILPAVRAYHAVMPLTLSELKALWPLIVARAGVLVASSAQQGAIDPDNAYVSDNAAHEREIFDVATSVPLALMERAILDSVGLAPELEPLPLGRLLPDIEPDSIRLADLGVLNPNFGNDNWSDPDIDWKFLARAAGPTRTASTRYGEYRLSYTKPHAAVAPATFALHIDVCLPAGTAAIAPFAGTLRRDGPHVVLTGETISLHVDGLDCPLLDGTALEAGTPLGQVGGEENAVGGLRLRLSREHDLVPPLFVQPAQAAIWSAVCPSPSALLGIEVDAPALADVALLQKRQNHFARPQKHYYAVPPQIERGWQQHLFDVTGRSYLDMVNNVTMVGHGHPRLSAAVADQWSMLNTNSRFHYAAVADFSERLAALAPEGLDTVFLVNSGSEANDLALRLAWAATGAKNMLCLLEAYHGWTVASDAISTSIADNPNALETRPDWVRPVAAPNTYRGPFRGDDTTDDYVATVTAALDRIDREGGKLAGFICESVYGNAGGIPLPDGYLQKVYQQVRARGGLCIADEVQVGYGRLGRYFWGFEQQGVVPDIVTIAKGMGNGHPLGAVITSRRIAEALEQQGYFFSSSGGSPVSCVVGIEVLDILDDEQLQNNARVVGEHLKARLESLKPHFPIVGAVHGMGLYLGLELVRDEQTLEPAREETAAICDRLLQLGVIMQPTGDHLNVLKIKPPLCLTLESADFFADMLEKVLREGW